MVFFHVFSKLNQGQTFDVRLNESSIKIRSEDLLSTNLKEAVFHSHESESVRSYIQSNSINWLHILVDNYQNFNDFIRNFLHVSNLQNVCQWRNFRIWMKIKHFFNLLFS